MNFPRECRVGLDRRADPRFRRGGAVMEKILSHEAAKRTDKKSRSGAGPQKRIGKFYPRMTRISANAG